MKIIEVFNANKGFYRTLQVWAAVVKQDGAWNNYYMKIMPSYTEVQESKPVTKTNSFMVLHEYFDIDDFQRLFDNLRNGKINVCGFEINFSSTEEISLDRRMDRIRSKWALDQFIKERYPFFRCEIRPSSSPSVHPDVELELKSMEEPYSDIRDVMEDLLRIKFGYYNAGSVAIHLPSYLMIRNSFFEENVLRFSAEFHQKMKDDLDLGIILRDLKGEPQRYSRPINEEKLKLSDGFYYYEDIELVNEDIISAEIFLRNKKSSLINDESGEIIRFKPSSQFEVFKQFWTENELERCLQGRFKEDQGFEWGISILLTLCGFNVHWIGWLRGQVALGGVDLFSFHNDILIVGECTVGTVGNDEIDKLLQAVGEIHETLGLKEKTTTLKIVPVIFTCVKKISNETKESANKSGIRIKDLGDIMEIFNALRMNKPKEAIINLLTEPRVLPMT